MNPKAYRLPAHALPRRYDVHIDARLGRKEVYGRVVIQLDVEESKDFIELHARDMQVTSVQLKAGGKTLEGKATQDAEREMARLTFGEAIPTGGATLDIEFDGQVSDGLAALYLAQDGPEKCLCTQCEATDARGIFPCFDEPTFKAQFAWHVTTDPEMTVIANGPLEKTEDGPNPSLRNPQSAIRNSKTWHFAPTKPMSSYLVALVIGDVASTEQEEVNGTPISIVALRGKEEMGRFAHDYTAKLLRWYEEYFDMPYHFDKYDQAAVPGFSAGAMENSGLVLYRQNLLLMNPKTASWNQEKSIAHVVAHETAHMWFGNVVTMKWWDDLWLNEAFAEWISYKAVNSLSPDYKLWNDFQGGKTSALASDALESTHPIYAPVETPDQAAEMFDNITYEKGCAVMRMLESFLGEEAFRAGLRTYMQEFKEGNAAGADLWRHLQKASEQPVVEMMESWIAQGGYPVVTVGTETGSQKSEIRVRQQRFFSTPKEEVGEQKWDVPLQIRYGDDEGTHETRHLLKEREATVPLEVKGELKWVYANLDEIGFYRQNLQGEMLDKALANLDKLTSLEQMGLLGDQWALVRSGGQTMGRFLDVLSAMSKIRDYSVLDRVGAYIYSVERLLEDAGDEEAIKNFRSWVDGSFRELLGELGYEPRAKESQNDAQSRWMAIEAMAGVAQNRAAIEKVTKYAEKEAEDPASVDPNLASTYVSIAAKYGDRARFDRFVDLYEKRRASGGAPQEAQRYLYSLPAFEKSELVKRTLELLDEKVLPLEAIGPTLRIMLSKRYSQLEAWDYLKKNWSVLVDSLGDMWPGFLVDATGQLPARMRGDMVAFYDANLNGVAEMSYRRALETLDQLAEFQDRTRDDLLAWFKK